MTLLADRLPAPAAVSARALPSAPAAGSTSSLNFSHLADLSLPFAPPDASGLDDLALLEAQRTVAEIRRRTDATAATAAAELAHRSRPELGSDGLAQRLGARTVEKLVQRIAGTSSRDAGTLVRVGALMIAPPVDAPETDPTPWLRAVREATVAGELSLEAADVIRAGLGSPDAVVTVEALTEAACTLLGEARVLTVEKLAARARDLRLELDLDRVAEREEYLRSKRYLHLYRQPDGMTRLAGLLDPESAAIVTATFDAVTSPRRGGPRFVDKQRAARAEAVEADERTTEQLVLDAFVELIRIGTAADAKVVLGAKRPAIKLLVTDTDLRARRGIGYIEGQTERVSIATVERYACTTGIVPIRFDDNGEALNLGREQRLYNGRHAIAYAAKDGGCQFGDCDRPPDWCEMHHIDHWVRDHGKTDLKRGMLLCRHHHMLVHNKGWEIIRDADGTRFIPPATVDPHQRPIPAPSKSAALQRLLARR
ncbi:MAG: DUF222 domain-containing protein [Rhodoglobus sp.]